MPESLLELVAALTEQIKHETGWQLQVTILCPRMSCWQNAANNRVQLAAN